MKRVIHKETKKTVIISDAHADSLIGGRDPKYYEDLSFDWEKIKAENEAKAEAKFKAEQEAAMKAAEEEEEAEEVSIEKEKKPSPVRKKKVSSSK